MRVRFIVQRTLKESVALCNPFAYYVPMPGPKNLGYLDCSIAQNVDIIGDRWNVMLIRDAFMGVRRFEDFANDLGIARNILSNRLERLVAAGVFETVQYQEHPPRDEYRLTEKGKDLMDVMLALWRWGDRWSPPTGDLRQLVHLDCGKPTYIVAACAHCGGELKRSNLRIEPGLDVVENRQSPAIATSP